MEVLKEFYKPFRLNQVWLVLEMQIIKTVSQKSVICYNVAN